MKNSSIDFPIVDAHIHLWDINKLSYPWLNDVPKINRTFDLSDYNQAMGLQEVQAMVYVQCECKREQSMEELKWVNSLADQDTRLQAIVPWAPLELGSLVEPILREMAKYPRVKGIRRIIEFEEDPDFCIQPGFVKGVQLLGSLGLHCELTIDPKHFPNVLRLIELCPQTQFILDHCGSPDIDKGELTSWQEYITAFSESGPHYCKFSNLICNADLQNWSPEDLQPYAETVLQCFSPDRLVWGSDWPHLLRGATIERWLEIAQVFSQNLSSEDLHKIFRDNAIDFYRLTKLKEKT
jgi:L-fuconolactonase